MKKGIIFQKGYKDDKHVPSFTQNSASDVTKWEKTL